MGQLDPRSQNPYCGYGPSWRKFDAGTDEADRRGAPGFNATAIDGMLRDAYAAGLQEGRREADSGYERVWDEGFRAGRSAGADGARAEIGKKLYQATTHQTERAIGKALKARKLAEVREELEGATNALKELWRELGAP